jgi:general stress protein CsbA
MRKKKKYISNKMIILIGVLSLFITGAIGAYFCQNDNNSDVAHWVKTNFFPADEYAVTSIMDADAETVSSSEYRGSTSSAWVLSFFASAIAVLIGFLILTKERKWW